MNLLDCDAQPIVFTSLEYLCNLAVSQLGQEELPELRIDPNKDFSC